MLVLFVLCVCSGVVFFFYCDCKSLVEKALQKGVLINNTGEHTLRLIPPLVVTKEEIDRVVEVISELL